MIIAGFGFRAAASSASLQNALTKASRDHRPDAVATIADKLDGLRPLAKTLNVSLISVSPAELSTQHTPTQSKASDLAWGTGSVAEAAALAAAGPDARLVGPRHISDDRMATCAIAIGGPI
ncbi:cobalamin biosynthesis protein [Pseudaestuariivita rosea]|uniref:cobalamin biosynthesis protein n=1 Tax=Pseudaestuariivita rosea TaxID=2763263 RepID=UPI001ABB2FD8|nr:cobalamin biosynthesis protein [Pseudaestuariivita rosea]